MIMHKIWNLHVYIYAMTSWSFGWVVKKLVCGYEDEGSILFNNIPNLVLHDYNMIICILNDYIILFKVWIHT
jgi:hypothetical protein